MNRSHSQHTASAAKAQAHKKQPSARACVCKRVSLIFSFHNDVFALILTFCPYAKSYIFYFGFGQECMANLTLSYFTVFLYIFVVPHFIFICFSENRVFCFLFVFHSLFYF